MDARRSVAAHPKDQANEDFGGGSRAEGLNDGCSSAAGIQSAALATSSEGAGAPPIGIRAGGQDTAQAGVQQSIVEWSASLSIGPVIVQVATGAATAVAGPLTNDSAIKMAKKSLVTPLGYA